MRAILTFLVLAPILIKAQYSFENEQLDTSNTVLNVYSNGALFNDPFMFQAGYEIPKGTSIHAIYAGGLWLGGFDDISADQHIAVNTYTDSVTDFFEGPIASNYDQAYNDRYADVWKISKAQIDHHVQNWNTAGYVVPDWIENWPAHGDAANGEPAYIAPFVDRNADNQYSPEDGDYPCIKGDQAVFAVFNDERYPHFRSFGKSLGVEVRLMAYSYHTQDEINNVTFFDYTIINRSSNNYADFRTSMWLDFDLGNPFDDYVGCNPAKNLIYAYNGDSFDENAGIQGYGSNPPAMGIKLLNDSLASFIAYQSGTGPTGDPLFSTDYFNYLNGKWKDGSSITKGGQGYGGTQPVEYIYDGSPSDATQWSEQAVGNFPGDRRALGSAIPRSFEAGDTIHITYAFIYARGLNTNNIQNVSHLDSLADEVQNFYDTSNMNCYTPQVVVPPTGIHSHANEEIELYPQPASDLVFLKGFSNEQVQYEVYTLDGKMVLSGRTADQMIYTSSLNNGLYMLRISNGSNQWVNKLAIQKEN